VFEITYVQLKQGLQQAWHHRFLRKHKSKNQYLLNWPEIMAAAWQEVRAWVFRILKTVLREYA
jgi:hypothetical protein